MTQDSSTLTGNPPSSVHIPIGMNGNHSQSELEAKVASSAKSIKGLAASIVQARKDRILRRFWESGTLNPHVAHLVYVLAVNESSPRQKGILTAVDGIDSIRRYGQEAVIELMNHYTNIEKLCQGGGLRGMAYCGEQEVFSLRPSGFTATSVGILDGLIHDFRRMAYLYGPEAAHGMDLSSKNYYAIGTKMSKALGSFVMQNGDGKKHPRDFIASIGKGVNLYWNGVMGEAFFTKEPLLQVFRSEFPKLKVRDTEGLKIMLSDLSTGEIIILDKDSAYAGMELDWAYDAGISFPFAFKHTKLDGRMLADGGLGVTPIRLAFQNGADFVYATFFNLFIPKKDDVNGNYTRGKIRIAYRVYEILQRDATINSIQQHTRQQKIHDIRDIVDPEGRLIVSTDDFSEYDTFELGKDGKYQITELPPKGRAMTNRTINKLDPGYYSEVYDPRIFLMRWENAKRYGPKLALR